MRRAALTAFPARLTRNEEDLRLCAGPAPVSSTAHLGFSVTKADGTAGPPALYVFLD
jgi:hypothetical protein